MAGIGVDRRAPTWDTERTDAIAPTGGVHASLADLSRYMIMHMQGGTYEGKEIIRRAAVYAEAGR